jgi:hypothetical protein
MSLPFVTHTVSRSSKMSVLVLCALSVTLLSNAVAQSNDGRCGSPTKECLEATSFFQKFQLAIKDGDREDVASLIRYPLRVTLKGHKALIRNRWELLRNYDAVFDNAVRCAIANGRQSDVWGNWQGFTVDAGPIWWEKSTTPDSPFLIIAVNNGGFYQGCDSGNKAVNSP